jgi:hypothetical protein
LLCRRLACLWQSHAYVMLFGCPACNRLSYFMEHALAVDRRRWEQPSSLTYWLQGTMGAPSLTPGHHTAKQG